MTQQSIVYGTQRCPKCDQAKTLLKNNNIPFDFILLDSDEKIKETYIKINGEYRDCVFTNNWLKK